MTYFTQSSQSMKICSIHIKGFQQFEDLYLDFTNPNDGEPVEKVCFIGRNGTGKSTLLRIIEGILNDLSISTNYDFIKVEIKDVEHHFYLINFILKEGTKSLTPNRTFCVSKEIDNENNWLSQLLDENRDIDSRYDEWKSLVTKYSLNEIIHFKRLRDNSTDLLIPSPTETAYNSYRKIEKVKLDEALGLFKLFPYYNMVSDDSIDNFWRVLIYLIKKRENDRNAFEDLPENQKKTKEQLKEEFNSKNEKILDGIAALWNKILDRANLEFDVENANNPIQLNDNLHAYIRHKKTKDVIHYSQLSTGIRNFIFRIGHIYSLYFNREIKRGFLLVDEPENSLFPDFLFELMELYDEIIKDKNGEKNTQMFFATHSPIVAAQFEPYERIVLEWDDEGHVTAHKGKSPVGDDPNDVLVNDFQLDHLMGAEGQKMWEEYLNLKKQLRHSSDPVQKNDLLSKINHIGQAYNFE